MACVAAGCSHHSDASPPTPRPTHPSTSTTTSPPPVKQLPRWPLTGLVRRGPLPKHPVYIVKIDNTSSSAPERGLDDADMIVQELVEGGITRLAVFFYSKIPTVVGPVRSMRASDLGIVEPAHAFLVASGAAGKTMMLMNQAGITRITENGGAGFYRSTTRPAPYNLMNHLTALANHVGRPWTPPRFPFLPFGPASQFHGTIPVTSMGVTFSGAHTDDWRLEGSNWVRTNSNAQQGHDFQTSNVLILRVQIGNAGYLDPAGNPVPETFFFGTGAATLVHGSHAENGTWHKAGTEGVVRLTTADGKPMTVPAGHTFVELVPANGGSVSMHH